MKIYFIGLGNPVPSFIKERIINLASHGVFCYVLLEPGLADFNGCKNIEIIPFPKSFRRYPIIVFRSLCSLLIKPRKLLRLIKILPYSDSKFNFNLVLKFSILIRPKSVDLVHLQWVLLGYEYHWLKRFYSAPLISSARGSQVTIFPTSNFNKNLLLLALSNVDYIHCVSNDILQHLVRFGINQSKLFVNYNGVDLDFFSFGKSKVSNVINLISVGSLIARKGYVLQLIILKQLLIVRPNLNLKIIGTGPEERYLIYVSQLLGVFHHVSFLGQKTRLGVVEELASSDIYLSTSFAEGLPNSVLEAVSTGLPVVSFEVEGINDLVITGKNGFVVPHGDLMGFTERIIRLIDDSEMRESFGIDSRLIAESSFDRNSCIEDMIVKYRAILEEAS